MLITGLAAPWATPSTDQRRPTQLAADCRLVFPHEIPVELEHKTTPHIVGKVVELTALDTGLAADSWIDDNEDLDLTGLSYSIVVDPVEMWTVDGVRTVFAGVVRRLALTTHPAFPGTHIEERTE